LKTAQLPSAPREVAPEETHEEASMSFKRVQLRLLMKEREEVVSRLVELDYSIWVLEEMFRTNPENVPLSPSGTLVPKGSLTDEDSKVQR
jgi:hypothetical protein